MQKTIQQTLLDITGLLDKHGIRYALVGGLAASIRGRTRVTEDVDLVLDCSVEGALDLLDAVRPDFDQFFPDVEQVVRSCFILPLEDRSSQVKIDLAVGISGFEQMVIDRATVVGIAGASIAVGTAEDVLLMKLLAGRPQDDQDIKGLVAVNFKTMDWRYVTETASQLQEAVGIDLVDKVSKLKSAGD